MCESVLGDLSLRKRLALGLTRGQLSRMIGSTNPSKMGSRIAALEKIGHADADLLARLSAALDIDPAAVDRLAAEDYRRYVQQWNAWADEPVAPHLVIRLMPAVYSRQDLPKGTTTIEQAEAWASARAKELDLRCCLIWSRRLSIFFAADGTVEQRAVATPQYDPRPYMKIGGRKSLLVGETTPQQPEGNP